MSLTPEVFVFEFVRTKSVPQISSKNGLKEISHLGQES